MTLPAKTDRPPSEVVRALLHGASWTVYGLKAVGGVYSLKREVTR